MPRWLFSLFMLFALKSPSLAQEPPASAPVSQASASAPASSTSQPTSEGSPAGPASISASSGATEVPASGGSSASAPARAQPPKARWSTTVSPSSAAAISGLCPGCGHFYLGERGTAIAYLTTTASLFAGGFVMVADVDNAPEADDAIGFELSLAAQNLWFYSIFDAYRDARLAQPPGEQDYTTPVSRESLSTLASAPFRLRVLRRPWVWAAVPLAASAGIAASALADPEVFIGARSLFEGGPVNFLGLRLGVGPGFALGEAYYAVLFTPVAVGEEALFRGFVQGALSERLGPWGGWATASLIFGSIHIFNFLGPGADPRDALIAVPAITGVGALFGLAHMKTGYQLETSVAMHFWYNFLLSTAAFVANPEAQPFVVRIGAPF